MTELTVGIQHIRDEIESQPASGAELSVVGLIGTAPGATAMSFPLNVPVYMTSNNQTMRSLLGATGTLPDAIRGVAGQLANGISAARMVIIRVTEGTTVAETIANILGNEALGTGMWAFLDAPADLSATPRLLGAPGLTSQFTEKGVINIPVLTQGAGYAAAPSVAITGGGGTGATAHAVLTAGKVTSIVIDNPGEGYTSVPTATLTGTATTVATLGAVAVGSLANPIIAGIPTILERLDGQFFPDGPTGNRERWLAYRETIQSERINHPMFTDVLVSEAGTTVTRPASPRVIGMYVAVDNEHGGRPFNSPANRAVYDIVGVSPPVPFSLRDPTTLGQEILSQQGGIIVKGETGVEAAVADGGFVFWGTDNCGEDVNWRLTNVVRGRDYLELTQLDTLKFYLGRYRIVSQLVFAVVETMRKHLQYLKDQEDILDFRTGVEPTKNPVDQLRIGNLAVMFRAEEAPVLKKLTVYSRRFPSALEALINSVATQLGSAA